MLHGMNAFQRVALVTGAGSGIGRTVARALARENYAVVLSGRRVELLEETASVISADRGTVLVAPADVTAPASVEGLFRAIQSRFGRLDLLFNNAGVGAPGALLEDVSFEQWNAVVKTCLTGTFLCTREAFKMMKAQEPRGGRIINNGSISAHVPRPNSAPYTAAKHGVSGLTKSTALDGRKYDIACGQIDIGNAQTEMTAKMQDGVPQADGSMAVEPTIDPEHVARAVLYMANLPLDANVLSLTVMATKMPYVGRG